MNKRQVTALMVCIAASASARAEISGSGHRVEGCTGEITSRVWNDANGNGLQDAGEPGLVGVTLALSRIDDLQLGEDLLTTDAQGSVRFFNLCLRPHRLRVVAETVPPGMVPTVAAVPTPGSGVLDSDATPDLAPVEIPLSEDLVEEHNVDFGLRRPDCTATIGNRVWLDENGNGLQDPEESGLAGITVRLFDDAAQAAAVAITDVDGRYVFAGVCEGSYRVSVDDDGLPFEPAPTEAGPDRARDSDNHLGAQVVIGGSGTRDIDFGFVAAACSSVVSGRVFDDANGDGLVESGEAGVPGITLRLAPVAQSADFRHTAVTDAQGAFRIAGLCTSTYELTIDTATLPGEYRPSFDIDAPLIVAVPASDAEVAVTPLGVDLDCAGRIGDYVWIDTDGDGGQGVGEVGLETVRVTLRDARGDPAGVRWSDDDGHYRFDNLCAGLYAVQVDASTLPAAMGPTLTGQASAELDSDGAAPVWVTLPSAGTSATSTDFGYTTPGCSLRLDSACGALSFQSANFECKKPINSLSMRWQGAQAVRIVAYNGDTDEEILADIDGIEPGQMVEVDNYDDAPKEVVWEVYAAGTDTRLGESWFDLNCDDDKMDGPEDCGLAQGDGKDGDECDDGCVTDWHLVGAVDKESALDCRPESRTYRSDCAAAVGQFVSFRHELRNVGGAAARDVRIDDDIAPEMRNAAPFDMPSGSVLSYDRTRRVHNAFVAGMAVDTLDGTAGCSSQSTVTVATGPLPECALYGAPRLEKHKDKIKWRLTNVGNRDLTVTKISVAWPAAHGRLKEIKLEDKFVDREVAPAYATFSDAEMVHERSKRRFKKNDSKKLEIKFKEDAEDRVDADYSVTIDFEGGCSLTFDTPQE